MKDFTEMQKKKKKKGETGQQQNIEIKQKRAKI